MRYGARVVRVGFGCGKFIVARESLQYLGIGGNKRVGQCVTMVNCYCG